MTSIESQLLFWRTLHKVSHNDSNETYLDELLLDSKYNIDVWYSACKDFTFPTQFIPISQEDVIAFKLYYEQKIMKLPKEKAINFKRIAEVEKKINEKIEEMKGRESGVFVRMSARSPKDSGFGSETMHSLIQSELDASGADLCVDATEKQNAEWHAFFEAQIKSLRSFSGFDAIQLLLDSERIYTDIKRALDLKEMKGEWNMYLAVRKWVPHSIQNEFRGFVYNKKLTALSQYFDMVYLPQLQEIDSYLKLIREFFDKVVNQIPYDNFIIDFAVDNNKSGCLFNWKKDLHLLQGKGKFEFRILKSPLEVIREKPQKGQTIVDMEGLDDEFKKEFESSLQLTESFLSNRLEQIQADLRYTLNKRVKD